MSRLRKLSLIHILILLNVISFASNAWSTFKPSKSWMVSKTSEARFIASTEEQPVEKSFAKMERLLLDCNNESLEVESRYVSFVAYSCEKGREITSIKNLSTSSAVQVFQSENFKGSEYVFLKEGKTEFELTFASNKAEPIVKRVTLTTHSNNLVE